MVYLSGETRKYLSVVKGGRRVLKLAHRKQVVNLDGYKAACTDRCVATTHCILHVQVVHLLGQGPLPDEETPFRVETGGASEVARIACSLRHDTAYKPHEVCNTNLLLNGDSRHCFHRVVKYTSCRNMCNVSRGGLDYWSHAE